MKKNGSRKNSFHTLIVRLQNKGGNQNFMSKKPKISVVVPVYNCEKYLSRCVQSLIAQDFCDFECHLIDDGSTDSSPALCDEVCKKDSRFFAVHQKNGGVSHARNTGILKACGEYIVFLDGDDFLEPNTLRLGIEKAEKYDCDVVIWKTISEGTFVNNSSLCGEISLKEIESDSDQVRNVWNKMIRKSLILEHDLRFDTRISTAEDTLFSYEVLFFSRKTYLLNESLYHYCNTQDSIMHSISNKMISDYCFAVKELELFSEQNPSFPKEKLVEFMSLWKMFYIKNMDKIDFRNLLDTFPNANEKILIELSDDLYMKKCFLLALNRHFFMAALMKKYYTFKVNLMNQIRNKKK